MGIGQIAIILGGAIFFGILIYVLLTNIVGSQVASSELPAPLEEPIIRCDLDDGTTYGLFVKAENVPDRGQFTIEGRLRSPTGEERPFSFSSRNYEAWSWEIEVLDGKYERHQEEIGEFTPSPGGTYEVVLDELEIEEAEYADKHALYIWKPMVNL